MTEETPEYNARDILIPIEEKIVYFYDDQLAAVLVNVPGEDSPRIFVPVKPITDNLGLDWSSQYRRIQRDPVLSSESYLIAVTAIESNRSRGNPEFLCLPVKFIPGFLFGISINRVREELREQVARYQRECYDVLHEAFTEGRLTTDRSFDEMMQTADPALVQAYQQAQAIVRLTRNQIIMDSRLDNYERRLEALEDRIAPGQSITEEQAMQISQAVKTVAMKLSKETGRNEYGAVYGELYRKFSITSYKLLPAVRFQDAMDFLTEWHEQLFNDPPF